MAVMPKFQNITTFETNNTGNDLSSRTTDFFYSGSESGLLRYVNISLPGSPGLNRKRTLFNRSALVSTNNLWKAGRGEFKSQIDYSFNRVTSTSSNVTTYFLEEGDRIVTEDRTGTDKTHSVSGSFTYENNQKTAFINNTLRTNLNWDDVSLSVTGSIPNGQSASLPQYFVGNNFKLIKRFSGKHLVTFKSINSWESLPQKFSVYMDNDIMSQNISDHAFSTNESAAYSFSIKGLTIGLEGGVKGVFRSFNSELPDLPEVIPGETANVLGTDYLTLYVYPKIEYWIKHFNFTIEAPVSYEHYSFDNVIANRSEVYFSPALSINWKLNNRFSLYLRGGTGRSPIDLNMIQPGLIMTDYRSFSRGVDDFYSSTSHNLSANIYYKHTTKGLFADASVFQSWTKDPYTMVQQLYGDYVVYSYSSAKSNGSSLIANCNIGKTLDFMRGSTSINGSFIRSEHNLFSEDQAVKSIGYSWAAGAKINANPIHWLGFDYRFLISFNRLSMNESNASWLGNMENYILLNIMPHKKWQWHICADHYRNELKEDDYKNIVLFDTRLVFKINKTFELSTSLSNILNQKTYSYKTYNKLNSFESRRQLRGREFLISISIKK